MLKESINFNFYDKISANENQNHRECIWNSENNYERCYTSRALPLENFTMHTFLISNKEIDQHIVPIFMEYMGLWVDEPIIIIREELTVKLLAITSVTQ